MQELKICWLGQGGYLLDDGKTRICIDPYLSDVVNRVAGRPRMLPPPIAPEELRCDVMVCTHDHLDHVDIDAIPLMNKTGMRFLAPTHARDTLAACGVTDYVPFDEGAMHQVGEFELEAVFADHSVPAIGVLVKHGGITLYFSGDTEYNERLAALSERHVDVMIVCINGKLGNMSVEEAVRLTREIAPRVGIPTHYGMFESNTEDPTKYTGALSCGFALAYGKEYCVKEILCHV